AKITNNGTLTTTGTALNGASQAGSSYGWADTYVTVNLGVLGVGQSTSVAYDLISHVFGNYGPVDCLGRFSNLDLDPGCVESYAHFGDPNQLNATPIPGIGIIAANAVPEPGTLGLLGLGGLAVLGLRRRRHP
ncbi:MAG: PEP-CTERM sorting domain-containing protein, partial [Gammaproteobacteria bacterium]